MACEKYGEGTMSLAEVAAELHSIFADDCVKVEQVQALLEAYKSNPADWTKYAIFDPYRYTRNLVDAGNGKFNLMVLAWGEGMGSSVHDHANSHCFVKVLDGQLMETQFLWPEPGAEEAPLELKSQETHKTDAVTYMSDEIGLHRMENPSHSASALSLHLYIPAFNECRTFDQRTGHARTVAVTFYSENGVKKPARDALRAPRMHKTSFV